MKCRARAGALSLATVPLLLLAAGACRTPAIDGSPPIVQPGAPGEASRVLSAKEAESMAPPGHTAADVRFMQQMIGHHAQALEMTALLVARTDSDAMRQLAKRIDVSQADEIRMMQDWLTSRGAPLPDPHAHHAADATLMPGMLTPAEMARLAREKGAAFDALFLEYMIKHHEGALVMVRELFATAGAAQESEIYAFASDVDADQRMEIARMGAMLKELQK